MSCWYDELFIDILKYFTGALVLSAVIVPLTAKVSQKIGYVDSSQGDVLKIHEKPVPHSGGVVIFVLFFLFLVIYGRLLNMPATGLLAGGGIAFFIGVWDDVKQTSPIVRLIGVLFAGIVMLISGNVIKGPIWIGVPLSLFYVLGAINAYNMQDGVDGLAGGLAFLSFLGFGLISLNSGQSSLLLIAFIICGLTAGFLIYNFNPASIFLGDGGSYFIGFLLAYFAVQYTDLSHGAKILAPILIIGIPVFDAAYAILRRVQKGVSLFSGDREHFYDLLMRRGLSVRKTVLVCWAIQFIIVGAGVYIYIEF